jgi:hypothetical protein
MCNMCNTKLHPDGEGFFRVSCSGSRKRCHAECGERQDPQENRVVFPERWPGIGRRKQVGEKSRRWRGSCRCCRILFREHKFANQRSAETVGRYVIYNHPLRSGVVTKPVTRGSWPVGLSIFETEIFEENHVGHHSLIEK